MQVNGWEPISDGRFTSRTELESQGAQRDSGGSFQPNKCTALFVGCCCAALLTTLPSTEAPAIFSPCFRHTLACRPVHQFPQPKEFGAMLRAACFDSV